MDIRPLRHFTAVAETLHFGRAAERLGMTQPPLSQSIMALEKTLGAPLFVRSKRSVRLSPLGEAWLPDVLAALAAVDELPTTARRLRDGQTGLLSLSFVSTADYSVLPDLVSRYSRAYPDVEIRLVEATSDVQIPAIVAGERHAGIIIPPSDRALPEPLAYQRLVSEPLVAAAPAAWIESGRLTVEDGVLVPEAIVDAPLILFPRTVAPAFHDLVTGYFARLGRPAHIVQEAIQMQTIISLVSAGLGVALVPASLRNLARAGVAYVEVSDPPTLETGLAWRRDDDTPTLREMLRLVGA
ncbi:LysR family transcriptional regulator [Caulobacter sp. D4A]|uniref:LysR family transcriptional regulator n=1 Tax=unclassified Caulobacter TaxID=2648921 RepID=UPI000D73C701|nr:MULTISPECIES: LysR family transcriptional regulator [unclassified Caulobacter]PXA80041.1 LysR family transcriptional regulator [Caulobacter sp. D4A]PXA91364.1 LysR family transcriptional regulator [Caulobacter sp. D5]